MSIPHVDDAREQPFPDAAYVVHYAEPFAEVREELLRLSTRLAELLPDPSIGPDERLERLARIVPNSVMVSQHRLTARTKLTNLRRRLDELVPGEASHSEKLETLVRELNQLVPGEMRVIDKLERLGDFRGTDTGVSPRRWQ